MINIDICQPYLLILAFCHQRVAETFPQQQIQQKLLGYVVIVTIPTHPQRFCKMTKERRLQIFA